MKYLFTTLFILAVIVGGQAQNNIRKMLDMEGYYQHFSGNVLIQSDSLDFVGSYGKADYSSDLKNSPSIPSDIGSITKQFTAAAILHLVQQGKISLQDPINIHLGDFASKRWEKVTIHHLLTHTSGIPSLFQNDRGMDEIWPTEEEVSREELIGFFRDKKRLFRPGKEYRYSNSGYALLATIIEQVAQVDYETFMEQELFAKYKLSHTSFGTPEEGLFARPSFGYRSDLTMKAPIYHKSWMMGAGGIYSTVEDLSRWVDVITSDTFLTEDLRGAYFDRHVSKRGGYYGYGWEIMQKYDLIQHDGTNFGYVSYLGFNPESGDRIILLTNQSYESIDKIGNSSSYVMNLQSALWSRLYDKSPLELLPNPASVRFTEGIYQLNDSVAFSVERMDSTFLVRQLGVLPITSIAQAYPISGDTGLEQRLVRISEQLLNKKFRKLVPDCDKQMRSAVKLGVISLGFRMITSDIGDIVAAAPYHLNDKYGLIRFTGDQGSMDLIIYFDELGLMQGIFEHSRVSLESSHEWIAYPVVGGGLFVDGFPYGESDVLLTTKDSTITLRQYDREFDVISVSKD